MASLMTGDLEGQQQWLELERDTMMANYPEEVDIPVCMSLAVF
jgi:hypothetical protein